MRYLKIMGLAAIAATALMAFLGAGTASATVLCKTQMTEGCAASGWAYPVGTKGVASMVGSGIMETLSGETVITCGGSKAEETLQNEGGAAATVTGESNGKGITWSECTTTVDVLSGGSGELHWIPGTDNGTVTAKGFEVTTSIFGTSCVYGLGSTMKDWGEVVGGAPGFMQINAVVPKISGSFLCPNETRLTAKYINTEPAAGYVAAS
jgi:hypothetical protein